MNIYRYRFFCHCPNNGQIIEYSLEIHHTEMVQVEHIVKACALHKNTFHEAIADALVARFGGYQILKAHHHGVDIETWRGKTA